MRADMLAQARRRRRSRRLADFGRYMIGDIVLRGERAVPRPQVGRHRRRARRATRSTTLVDIVRRRRPAHGAVAAARRRQRRRLGAPPGAVGRRPTSCSAAPTPAPTSTACSARPIPTRFLADSLRGRQLRARWSGRCTLMTDIPARLFGLRDRGRVEAGRARRPRRVRSRAPSARRRRALVFDLPGRASACSPIRSASYRVFVNGAETLVDGEPTGAVAGTVLRSGRDTTGPDLRWE